MQTTRRFFLHRTWVPHPCDVFALVARVGLHEVRLTHVERPFIAREM